jgi:hypothetical protein
MNKTVIEGRSNCGVQAWPGQTTVAVLPSVSPRTFSNRLPLSVDAPVASQNSRDLSPQSPKLTVCGS